MKNNNWRQPIKYFLVGGTCQIFDYLITFGIFFIGLNLFISNSFGYIFSSTLSYIFHTKYTFKKKSRKLASKDQIIFFVLACFLGTILGYIFLKIFLILEINFSIAKLMQLFSIAIVK